MRWTAAVLLAALSTSSIASAQQPPPAATPATPAADPKEEARQRYDRGMQLYNDGAYDLALIEINRAYDLAPSYKLLYNVAQINAQLQNYAGALRAFERYLAEGGAEVPAKRQEEVTKEIANLRARTANLTVTLNVEGAEILVDGFPQTMPPPGQPLLVNAGVRKVGARKAGFQPVEQVFTLAGGDKVEVKLELIPVASTSPTPAPTPPPAEREKGPSYLWIGWVTTGAFTAGAVVTGIATLSAASDRDDELATPAASGQTAAEKKAAIDDAESSRTTLAVMTDIFAGAAIIAGGVTLAFTIAGSSDDKAAAAEPRVQVGVRPNGVDLAGSF